MTAATAVQTRHGALWRVRFGLIAALMIVLPFFSGSTQYIGVALSELLLLALAGVAIAEYWQSGRDSFRLSRFEVLGIMVFAAAVLAGLGARYSIDAWHAVGGLLLLGVGFRAARTSAERDSYTGLVGAVLLAGGALQALSALHQYFFTGWYREALPGYFGEYLAPNLRDGVLRVVGGFIDPNNLAAYLNVCFALALALLLFGAMRLPAKIVLIAAGALYLVAIGLTGSKAGMAVTMVIAAALLGIKDKRLLAVIALIVVLLIALPNPAREQYIRALTADPYLVMRVGIWGSSLQMALDHPLTGVGPGNFIYYAHRYQPETPQFLVHYSHIPNQAHNSYLHAFAELGLIGLVPLLLMVGAAAVAFRAVSSEGRSGGESARRQAARLGFAAGIAGLMIHSLVHNTLHNRCLLATALLLTAAIAGRFARAGELPWDPFERRYRVDLTLPKRVTAITTVSILLIGFALAQIVRPLDYESKMQETGQHIGAVISQSIPAGLEPSERERLRAGAAAELGRIAVELEAFRRWYPANAALLRYLGATYREIYRATGDPAAFTRAVLSYRAAEGSQPGRGIDAFQQLNAHLELARWNYPKTPEMIETMESLALRALEQWPQRAAFHLLAAVVEGEKGSAGLAESRRLLERAIELEPNYLQAIAELRALAERTGDEELATRAERLYAEAERRIAKGPSPDRDDSYARQILAPPTGR